MQEQREYFPMFLFLKRLQAIDSSFVTIPKPLNNKIADTFGEGLTWKSKLFEIDRQ